VELSSWTKWRIWFWNWVTTREKHGWTQEDRSLSRCHAD